MSRCLTIHDLHSRIDWALAKCWQQVPTSPPVDLDAVCRAIGVAVERRPMVPEGVLLVTPSGLRICLQNNFDADPAHRRRQRFTWAHEICHALFFKETELPPQPLENAPKGETLEHLCQRGARALLIPSTLISKRYTPLIPVSSVADLDQLIRGYDVSTDAAIRRLHELDSVVLDGFALVLTRLRDGIERVHAACHGPWLFQYLPAPNWGMEFSKWAAPVLTEGSRVTHCEWLNRQMGLKVVANDRTHGSRLIEFRRI